jgi:hypothetical protein
MASELVKADRKFSEYIRRRDGRCKNPRCTNPYPSGVGSILGLDCAHYYLRGQLVSRYDPDNCIALCRLCHTKLEDNKEEHRKILESIIGTERLKRLEGRMLKYKHGEYISQSEAIKKCYKLIKK